MTKQSQISRRQFVGTAISAAAVGSLPIQNLLASSWAALRLLPVLTGKMRAFYLSISLRTPSCVTYLCGR